MGVRDNDLAALFRAEIGKLLKHLVRGFEIERQIPVRVLKAAPGKQNVAEKLLLGVKEMHVARGNDGFSKLFAQCDDAAVKVAQLVVIFGGAVFQHKGVVAYGLNFKVIVKLAQALKLLVAPVAGHCLKHLARLARRADNQPLAVLQQQAFRDDGGFAEVFQMGF